ncbi:hypothetical protein BO94DRAFT_44021 [Aspergillus sclerotioniger CBS 115572]|uniref:Uncharacterized protein n=1 Tax=Aspergillus sclerotioniger CBS 115572 TaxID=1450535 RepID=A0A317WTN9_9EURO|nr:hypothetical protein BO94DRAFT_44021 [Aspergillus sclerotioniger CBS 115572]PWY89706.1 hypothetical protein BO94DRAFT_44021 [Aspergillus sclerotioniger CBS 115572]
MKISVALCLVAAGMAAASPVSGAKRRSLGSTLCQLGGTVDNTVDVRIAEWVLLFVAQLNIINRALAVLLQVATLAMVVSKFRYAKPSKTDTLDKGGQPSLGSTVGELGGTVDDTLDVSESCLDQFCISADMLQQGLSGATPGGNGGHGSGSGSGNGQ